MHDLKLSKSFISECLIDNLALDKFQDVSFKIKVEKLLI